MESRRMVIRTAGGRISILAAGIVASGQALAAQSLVDVDWRSYLDWHSYTDWQLGLLVGSAALLVVALILKIFREAKEARESEPEETGGLLMRRIGTMPLEPARSAEH